MAGLQAFAISLIVVTPDGKLSHGLTIIEANSIDAAEGRVLAKCAERGEAIIGLLSRSCLLEDVTA